MTDNRIWCGLNLPKLPARYCFLVTNKESIMFITLVILSQIIYGK